LLKALPRSLVLNSGPIFLPMNPKNIGCLLLMLDTRPNYFFLSNTINNH